MRPSVVLVVLTLAACGGSGRAGDPSQDKPVQATTLAAVGLDPTAIDRSVDPCDDFFQYACGGWLKQTEIPADRARYGRFAQIGDRNEVLLKGLLEDAARTSAAGAAADADTTALGNFYGACMDEAAVEQAGTRGVDALLAAARGVRDRRSLEKALATLNGATVWVPFGLGVEADFKDATTNAAFLGQGGLGLPDRDYYLSDDPAMKKARDDYRAHLERTFALLGMQGKPASEAAGSVLDLETKLAKAQRPKEELRDPDKIYNKLDRAALAELMPGMKLDAYLEGLGLGAVQAVIVTSPDFQKAVDELMNGSMPSWRNYLAYHIVRATSDTLPKRYVDEFFSLTRALTGTAEIRPRWKRCIEATDDGLGELLGKPFVARTFGPEAKQAADSMVTEISKAMAGSIDALPWMSAETKAKAHAKLATVTYLVGYPATWKTYDFEIDRADWAGTALRAARFEQARELAKIGKPYDRAEWHMTPQTVNAYYNPLANQMVFPAGILQTPFFSASAHPAVNLGAIGMVVGHELTHGFDDEGAKFGPDGNLHNWWGEKDLAEFTARGKCVGDQYSSYDALPGLKVNGTFTKGENIADIGGVKIAFKAYRQMRASAKSQTVADGYTEDQMFFLAVGQAWCSKQHEAESRRRVFADPHAPPHDRVNGSLSDQPEFADAFKCSKGTRMAPTNACTVW
jgi:putative endopeptidase